jgi:hypothetical protein
VQLAAPDINSQTQLHCRIVQTRSKFPAFKSSSCIQ